MGITLVRTLQGIVVSAIWPPSNQRLMSTDTGAGRTSTVHAEDSSYVWLAMEISFVSIPKSNKMIYVLSFLEDDRTHRLPNVEGHSHVSSIFK